jgi:predicted DNA-binding transcriptional regulator AlpA
MRPCIRPSCTSVSTSLRTARVEKGQRQTGGGSDVFEEDHQTEILMPADRLITAEQVAELLGCSTKTIRRYAADTNPARVFPVAVELPSPTGTRPLVRWKESEVLRFAGLE